MPELPLIADDDPDSFVSLGELGRGVLLALALATMRLEQREQKRETGSRERRA